MRKQLLKKTQFINSIRSFFSDRDVLEVTTKMLSPYTATDVYIDSIKITVNEDIAKKQNLYLHTSPEFQMKQLLLRDSGDIYQICQVFRDNEYGELNSNEFTMLEWYRLNMNYFELMDEVEELIKKILGIENILRISYKEAFYKFAAIDNIHLQNINTLTNIAKNKNLNIENLDLADIQMLLFVDLIEPELKKLAAVFIYNYPKQQAAFAKINKVDNYYIAERFELFIKGVELANGYHELQDVNEHKKRFLYNLAKRKDLKKHLPPLDSLFLNDLNLKLPYCSGVAMGIDRLFMFYNNEL